MVAAMVTMVFGAAAFLKGASLVRRGQHRDAAAFFVLLLGAYAISMLLAVGVRVPNISTGIWRLVRSMVHYK